MDVVAIRGNSDTKKKITQLKNTTVRSELFTDTEDVAPVISKKGRSQNLYDVCFWLRVVGLFLQTKVCLAYISPLTSLHVIVIFKMGEGH